MNITLQALISELMPLTDCKYSGGKRNIYRVFFFLTDRINVLFFQY